MSKSKYGFAFFLTLYVSIINSCKPAAGWPFLAEAIDTAIPAIGALFSHITVIVIIMLRLPTEDQVSSAVTLWRHKRRIKKQLKDPMNSPERRARLLSNYEQVCDDQLKVYTKIEPAKADEKN